MTNLLLFRGSAAEWRQAEEVVALLDAPGKQVALEAQVVAINKTNTKDLGLDWTWENTPQYPEVTTEDGTTTYTRTNLTGTIKYGKSPAGIPYEFYYSTKISALINNGNAKILAKSPTFSAVHVAFRVSSGFTKTQLPLRN